MAKPLWFPEAIISSTITWRPPWTNRAVIVADGPWEAIFLFCAATGIRTEQRWSGVLCGFPLAMKHFTDAELRQLAERNQPPQEWFDQDEECPF